MSVTAAVFHVTILPYVVVAVLGFILHAVAAALMLSFVIAVSEWTPPRSERSSATLANRHDSRDTALGDGSRRLIEATAEATDTARTMSSCKSTRATSSLPMPISTRVTPRVSHHDITRMVVMCTYHACVDFTWPENATKHDDACGDFKT
jgi:hypothetical protein